MIQGLNELLTRLKRSLEGDKEIRESVSQTIKETVGFEILAEDISLKDGFVRIKTSPAKRNEISLREEIILGKLRNLTKLNLKKILY